jgi:hypothetical protein
MNKVISHLSELFLKYFYKYIHKYIHKINNPIFLSYHIIKQRRTTVTRTNKIVHLKYLELKNIDTITFRNFKNKMLYLPPWCKICYFHGINYHHDLTIVSDNLEEIIQYPNISCDNLPKSLRAISFHDYFDQPLDNLPNKLEIIEFSSSSNISYPLSNLPITIHTIINHPNVPCDLLPVNLKKITFGLLFDQNIDNLPSSIKYIRFETCNDQSIDNLPQSVEKLCLNYDSLMEATKLPNKLKYLRVFIGEQIFAQRSMEIKHHLLDMFSFDNCEIIKYPNRSVNDDYDNYDDYGSEIIFTKN